MFKRYWLKLLGTYFGAQNNPGQCLFKANRKIQFSYTLQPDRTRPFFWYIFLLEFDLPTYSITPSAHPIKCPPQCLSPSHPIPLPISPSTTPCSFPRVRSLSCSVTLSDFSGSLSLLSPIIPFTIFYIPCMSETI